SLALGSLPFFIGLVIVIPVLGHATWHLYREVVLYALDPLGAVSRSGDVGPHVLGLPLDLADPLPHHIADRHQPGQSAARDYRHMTETTARHLGHELVDGVVLAACDYARSHDRGDRSVEDRRAPFGEGADDVAFRNDP